jgi:hypothetical protein
LPHGVAERMAGAMMPRSPLDDPDTATQAWARYKRLMRFMMLITLIMVGASFAALYRENGLVSAHLYVAAAIMVGFAMLLTSALMGLVFLSSGSGHDEAITEPLADENED